MMIRRYVSLVLLLGVITLGKVPTVRAVDCTGEGEWIGGDCAGQNGEGDECLECVWGSCDALGGNDLGCAVTCSYEATRYCS